MRTRAMAGAALLALGVSAPASAIDPIRGARGASLPQVRAVSCYITAENGVTECLVQLLPNASGRFIQSTHAGYASADLICYGSGTSYNLGGYVGTDWIDIPHGADTCLLRVTAPDGVGEAAID